MKESGSVMLVTLLALSSVGVSFWLGASRGKEEVTCPVVAAPFSEEAVYSSRRDSVVAQAAAKYGVPIPIALAVTWVENCTDYQCKGYDSTAVSSAGAVGIMQVMPFWGPGGRYDMSGQCIERTGPPWSWPLTDPRDLTDMELNACLGVLILKQYKEQHGDWYRALLAYNGALNLPEAGNRYVRKILQRLDFTGLN